MSTRILVTGAAGFVGSFVASHLAARGYSVVGADNFNDYYSVRLKHERVESLLLPAGVECRTAELSDENEVRKLFDEVRPELVLHLAAQAGVRYSLTNPQAYVRSNLVAFSHILEACRVHCVRHLVYASSSSVYGENAKVPFSESDQTDSPISLYAATKKSNELMAHAYSKLYRLPSTGVRFFTVYGPWGRPDMAYFSFAEKMLRGESIPVYGEGKLYRDFTYINDIVEGVARLLHKPMPINGHAVPHSVFNIGNHQPVTVLDFVRTLETVLGVNARMTFLPVQPGDVSATHASNEKLRNWIGFAPDTALGEGLRHFCDWFVPRYRRPI